MSRMGLKDMKLGELVEVPVARCNTHRIGHLPALALHRRPSWRV